MPEILRIAARRWPIVAAIIALSVLGGGLYGFLRAPQYSATATLYVSAQTGDNPQQAYQGAQLSEQRVRSYTQLALTNRVLGAAIAATGLQYQIPEFAEMVSTESNSDSVVIGLSATARSADEAAQIANAVSQSLIGVVTEIERPAGLNGIPPVELRVVQSAEPPTEQSSITFAPLVALFAAAGVAVGLGAVTLVDKLDTRLRSVTQLEEELNGSVMGAVPFDPGVNKTPLAMTEDATSMRAESYRHIRTNLGFVEVDKSAKVLTFSSSVAGEGKSTTVANLASLLGLAGHRTLVIDADLRRPTLWSIFGVEKSVGLTTVLSGQLSLRAAVQPWNGGAVDVLASGALPPNPSEMLASRQMRSLLTEAKSVYQYVLLDCPPLLPVTDAAAVSSWTDGVILIVSLRGTTSTHLDMAQKNLRAAGLRVLGTIATKTDRSTRSYHGYGTYGVIDSTRRGPSYGQRNVSNKTSTDHDTLAIRPRQVSRETGPEHR